MFWFIKYTWESCQLVIGLFQVESPVRNPRIRSPKREECPLNPCVQPSYTDPITDDNNPDLIPPTNGEFNHSKTNLHYTYFILYLVYVRHEERKGKNGEIVNLKSWCGLFACPSLVNVRPKGLTKFAHIEWSPYLENSFQQPYFSININWWKQKTKKNRKNPLYII